MATEALSDSIEFIGAIQINLSIYLSIYLGRNVLLFNTVIVNFELAASTICCLLSELIILREIALYLLLFCMDLYAILKIMLIFCYFCS